MAEIKESRQSLEERDFPILEKMAEKMKSLILESYSCDIIENTWPFRYSMRYKEIDFEWVFSAMGSVTLRIAKSERYRRNPPPIFYLSVGKYSGLYRWEDGDATESKFEKNVIIEKVNNSIERYIEGKGTLLT